MGLAGTLLSKIGLPIALIAGAGFLLFTFRKPILEAVGGGAQTLGSIISSPIGAILEGIKQGFTNIPEVIPITFPRFEFGFAEGQDPGGSKPNVPAISEEGFDFDQALTNLCRNSGGILCFQEKQQMEKAEEVMDNILPKAEGSKFTLFKGGSILVNLPSLPGGSEIRRERLTREEIVKTFPNAVGLFDLLSTKQTEFLPLSERELKQFPGDFRLSGQLFNEIKNISDVLA